MRIQHEIEPSCVLRTFLGMTKICVARNGAAEGFKTPDGHRMGNDALTNSPMSSRYVPNLKISIIVCPACVQIG